MNNQKFTVYPSITTTPNANWRKMVEDVSKLEIKKICLFPTFLGSKSRKELYRRLEESSVEEIPLVHLRHDMNDSDVKYFKDRFKTELFNLHSKYQYPLQKSLIPYQKNSIALEFTLYPVADELNDYAGVCLDVSHVENEFLNKSSLYNSFVESLNEFPTKVWHISAIKNIPRFGKENSFIEPRYDFHKYDNLNEFEYIKRYKKYIAPIIALELENPIEDQLKAQKYVSKLLS